MFQPRTYRKQFNTKRFAGFGVQYLETDLWIGCNPAAFHPDMEGVALKKIKNLRGILDEYISHEPAFAKSLKPYSPADDAPEVVRQMAEAAARAGVGPMASVAGLFAREVGSCLKENFSMTELVIENGGDISAVLEKELTLSVFAGDSPLSERIGLVVKPQPGGMGICTSAGTVGPSLSYGKADAVVVVAEDVLVADAWATAIGNRVKSPDDVEKVINRAVKIPGILSLLIICQDQVGIWGENELKILK